jgi:hypothetical protein
MGKTWVTSGPEVERYRRANLGRPGRLAPINPNLVRTYFVCGPIGGRGSDAWLMSYENETFLVDPGGGNQVPFEWAGQPAIEPIDSRTRAKPPGSGFDPLVREQVEAILRLDLDLARKTLIGFPEPAVVFRAGPVWNAAEFERWCATANSTSPPLL